MRWCAIIAVSLVWSVTARAQDATADRPEPAPVDAALGVESVDDAGRAEGDAADAEEAPPEEAEEEEEEEAEEPEPPPHPIERRELPDYDGRAEPPRPLEDVLLDVPRLLLSPIYVVLEYVIRQPLAWLVTTAEREQWDLFRYLPIADDPLPWGIVPTGLIDFGFLPSIGAFAWFNEAFAPDNHLTFQVGFGGPEWLRGTVIDRFPIGENATLQLMVDAWQRPDYLFMGIGPNARPDRVSRYGRRFIDGNAQMVIRPYRSSQIRLVAGVSANEFYGTNVVEDDEVDIREAVARGWFQRLPAGFADGYFAYSQRLELALDTRQAPPEDAGGIRVDAHAELGFDMNRLHDRRWVLWGGALGGYVDVGSGRTIGAWVATELASHLGTEEVPFAELVDLAVIGRMPGFRNGWIVGTSAMAGGIDYGFPVAPWLEGFVAVSTGGAFGDLYDGFRPGLLRMSYAIGVRAGSPDQPFAVMLGMGSAPFEDGAGIQVFRVAFGVQQGGL